MHVMLAVLVLGVSLVCAGPARAADPIFVSGSGIWDNGLVITGNGFGYLEWNVWVDASVENRTYDKRVGMVWTDDTWVTHRVAYLAYEQTLADGREQWGVDLRPAGRFDYARFRGPLWINANTGRAQPGEAVTIEYALFYEVDGQTYWANNGAQNYRIAIPGGGRRSEP